MPWGCHRGYHGQDQSNFGSSSPQGLPVPRAGWHGTEDVGIGEWAKQLEQRAGAASGRVRGRERERELGGNEVAVCILVHIPSTPSSGTGKEEGEG